MEDKRKVYDGLVGVIWDWEWTIPDDDDDYFDEDTDDRVLVYDVVILGSARVFDHDEWDVLYHHVARWASIDRKNLFYDNV